jgi:hypothetical protein
MGSRIWGLGMLVLASIPLQAQWTTVYSENFDSLPHASTTYHSLTGTSPYFNDTTALAPSSIGMSMHAKVVTSDTIYLETSSFSTVGNSLVQLTFDHIAKVQFGQRAKVQVSINGGATWTTLGAAHYQGSSSNFGLLGYFNEVSYMTAAQQPYWGGPSITSAVAPTSSWWASETFDISSIAGNNGYPNVKIRFVLKYVTPASVSPAGWFIDNVVVKTAPCEFNAPLIKWNSLTAKKPEGVRFTSSVEVKFRAVDPYLSNSGIDSAALHYRVNGGAWAETSMNLSSWACADSSMASWMWNNVAVGDTVDWWVEAFDCSCNHSSAQSPSAPGSYYTFWRESSPPAMCGSFSPTAPPFIITAVPHTEDFEGPLWVPGSGSGATGFAHRGLFPIGNPPTGLNYQVTPVPTSTGFGWSVRAQLTVTSGTGPAADHTSGTGRYLYTESSQGLAGDVSTFTTPCIKLDNLNDAGLEFFYHRYGAAMGQLRVDIDTGAGFNVGSGVLGVLTLTGSSQSSATDAWSAAVVNLQPYLGRYIRVRFTAQKSSSSDLGDMAIDDIGLFEAQAYDVAPIGVSQPAQGKCAYGSQELVRVAVVNRGSQLPSVVPLAFSVTNLSTGVIVVHRDTLAVTWSAGRMATLDFTDKADLSAVTDFELRVWSELAGDATPDTIGPLLYEYSAPITLPFYENFDGPGWVPSSGIYGNPGTMASTDWQANPGPFDPATGDIKYSFYVGRNLTRTPSTGPRWSRGERGNYLYAEGNSTTYSAQLSAFYESKCINLSGAANPMFSFWYHMYGAGCGSLKVEVWTESTQQWSQVTGAIVFAPAQLTETDAWRYLNVPLQTYVGQNIKIRIRAMRTNGSTYANIAFDELRLYDASIPDVGVVAIPSPNKSVNVATPPAVQVTLRNFSNQAVQNIPVTIKITPLCGSVTPSTYTHTVPSLGAYGIISVSIPHTFTYTPGDVRVEAYTTLPTDVFLSNDTLAKVVSGQVTVPIPFGPESFEGCSANEFPFFVPQGGLQIWEKGVSTKGLGAASGTQAWHTGLAQDPYGSTVEYLRFPPFVGFDTVAGAELRLKHRYSLATADGANLQYSNGSTWQVLGAGAPNATNGYTNASSSALAGEPGWSGSSGGQYITSSLPLDFWSGNVTPLYIRAQFGLLAGINGNWSIDDVEVVVPPQHSVLVEDLRATAFGLTPGDSTAFLVKLHNNGRQSVQNVTMALDGLAAPVTRSFALVPPLPYGMSRWVAIPGHYVLASVGTSTVCARSVLVNNRVDAIPNGDTACTQVVVQLPVQATAANPFCEDFEQNSWSVQSSFGGGSSWSRGTPNHGSLTTAYNGSKSYATAVGGTYSANAHEMLYSPSFVLDSGTTYRLSFYHSIQSEDGVDGGMIEFSLDGASWHPLGATGSDGSVNWNTSPSVVSLDGLSGWSGTASSYTPSSIRFTAVSPQARFRWVFRSSPFVHSYGWAVDEVCLEADSGPSIVLTPTDPVYNSGCR